MIEIGIVNFLLLMVSVFMIGLATGNIIEMLRIRKKLKALQLIETQIRDSVWGTGPSSSPSISYSLSPSPSPSPEYTEVETEDVAESIKNLIDVVSKGNDIQRED